MAKNNGIRIRGILLKNYIELNNISGNMGIPFSLFMKQTLTKIADSYPVALKTKQTENEKQTEMIVRAVSEKTFNEIENICENLGCDLSPFLKIELKKISGSYPDKLKQKPLDY